MAPRKSPLLEPSSDMTANMMKERKIGYLCRFANMSGAGIHIMRKVE